MKEAKIDSVYKGKANGKLAQRLLSNSMGTRALRTNSTLRKDEWKQYDEAVIKAAQPRLNGVADLMSRGLVYRLGNGLGKTVLEYEDVSDIEGAQMDMDGANRGQNDRVEYGINYLPLPIIHSDFSINVRSLNASRNTGDPLDTTMAELSGQKVSEKMEELLFQGSSSYTFGGGTLYGYVDAPNRNHAGSLTANWDSSSASGETIVEDVRNMKQEAIDAKHYGPFVLYIPTAYETILDDDYVSGYPKTIRERILEIASIEDVKVADKLAANNVLLVQMTSDVVRMVEGLPIQTVEWDVEGGMILNFKVMTISVPQIRATQEGDSGIVHYS